MNCGQQLRDLLAPLGVYRWDGSFQWGELQSEGEALDGIAAELARIQREMHLATAREEGLTGLQAAIPLAEVGSSFVALPMALWYLKKKQAAG